MIPDWNTNSVYFSQLLQEGYPYEWQNMLQAMTDNGINHDIIKSTNDIWCRDYMPIQTTVTECISFRYSPSYLNSVKYRHLKTDLKNITLPSSLNTTYSDINLDGGNVVRSSNTVIITDRVFEENNQKRSSILDKLEQLLQCKVIIIPSDPEDMTGHSDGIVRFMADDKILVNQLSFYPKSWRNKLANALKSFELIELPISLKLNKIKDSANGVYVNFLQVGNVVLFPIFQISSDDIALETMIRSFPKLTIIPIDVRSIGNEGGLLNCVSWNLKIESSL